MLVYTVTGFATWNIQARLGTVGLHVIGTDGSSESRNFPLPVSRSVLCGILYKYKN
jgi:hypothetical protein